MRTFPHCDARVLHAPSECAVCDEHAADLQAIRKVWGINFTNHHETIDQQGIVMLPCPAEVARPLSSVNRWGGNTAKTQADWDKMEQEMKDVLKKYHLEDHDDQEQLPKQ